MTDRDPTPLNAIWRGHTQYQCRLCAFNTLEEQQFVDHFANMHPPLEIIDGGRSDEAPEPVDLSGLTRAELDGRAVEYGIEAPEKLANKGEVIAAIEAAQEGDA